MACSSSALSRLAFTAARFVAPELLSKKIASFTLAQPLLNKLAFGRACSVAQS
jgi:hypothetical protein